MLYRLKKPNLSRINRRKVFNTLSNSNEEVMKAVFKAHSPKYLYWDKVKYKEHPKSLSKEEFWFLIKWIRKNIFTNEKTVLRNEKKEYFTWTRFLSGLEEFFNDIDLSMGGSLLSFFPDMEEKNKYRFVSMGIMEEAIASSQLEGANTSRKAAKKFLREGRKPKNNSERMILNNYSAIRLIDKELKNEKMSLDMLFDLHSVIMKGTINSDEMGRFRRDSENIIVGERKKNGIIYHIPPKQSFIKKEIKRLIDFANDELQEGNFIHPVIKAIMLHFWIGYLHPFTDGNGRMARAIFYWYLLRKNYWAFIYLPISKIIRNSPSQYGNAYIYSEQDDLDLTYFIDYNIRKIRQTIEEFKKYIERKRKENMKMAKLARSEHDFNDRQIRLLQYLFKNENERAFVKMHMNANQISRSTAISDLKGLESLGFLSSRKIGKTVYYYPTSKINKLL